MNGRSADTNVVVSLRATAGSIPSAAKYRHCLEVESAVVALVASAIAAHVLIEPLLPLGG